MIGINLVWGHHVTPSLYLTPHRPETHVKACWARGDRGGVCHWRAVRGRPETLTSRPPTFTRRTNKYPAWRTWSRTSRTERGPKCGHSSRRSNPGRWFVT
uniref:Uncharacterized protein n=1 Tax=Cacopsylla melanoneura TaxID=428564 RepID=A0A8D8ZGU1_9HEMI